MMTTVESETADALLDAMPSSLKVIAEKALTRQRLSAEDGLTLLTQEDEAAVGRLADFVRRRDVGDAVSFATTLYVHPTNLCELSCPMCSFYAKPGWESAWFLTPKQVEQKVRAAYPRGLTEIHVVGGLWRDCNLDYYQDLFTRIKQIDPSLHIKALTPVEYDFLAKLHGISVDEVFQKMMSWGLGSLPGGGAEILVEEIRKQIAPQKITSEEFLHIHKIAHQLGLPTNITMLFNHVEDPKHKVEHLLRVRELQDETGGFRNFVPLKYHVENNSLGKRQKRLKPPVPLKLVYATSRLMLDNLPNLKVLWNYLGVETAMEMLQCGGNDLSSTNEDERIIVMAGGVGEKVKMTADTLSMLIRRLGREPQLTHSGAQ
jgi:aminodeoxyfutalosine synthase